MYLKLTLRNARRSALDYLLYIFTLTVLMTIMTFSNCVSDFANEIGFQAIALPILIVMIMAVLVGFVNMFMVKQRANEFATYMLLGIEKEKLTSMFLCEIMLISLFCCLVGMIIGAGSFSVYFVGYLSGDADNSLLEIILKGSFQSLICFLFMEAISILIIKRKIRKLQIIELMREKRLNQPFGIGKKRMYFVTLLVGSTLYLLLFAGIFSNSKKIQMFSVSLIFVPLLIYVFAFFKWVYCCLGAARLTRSDFLHSGTRLYWIADMTSNSKTSANLNSIFCISMLFSEMSFIVGEFMLTSDGNIFAKQAQQYMGFLQICICIIFILIYFSILSLTQIMQLKNETRNADLLFCIGKTYSEIKTLIWAKALVKLLFPALISFVIVGAAAPFINYKLNSIMPIAHNLTTKALGWFVICFVVLFVCYSAILFVYISKTVFKERPVIK